MRNSPNAVNWEDFVHLAFRGKYARAESNNLQIARRLRAMIENLTRTLPEYRHPALEQELGLLDREVVRHFHNKEDLALALIADTQGLGGRAEKSSPVN